MYHLLLVEERQRAGWLMPVSPLCFFKANFRLRNWFYWNSEINMNILKIHSWRKGVYLICRMTWESNWAIARTWYYFLLVYSLKRLGVNDSPPHPITCPPSVLLPYLHTLPATVDTILLLSEGIYIYFPLLQWLQCWGNTLKAKCEKRVRGGGVEWA